MPLPFENIKRDVLVRKEAKTDPQFGTEPSQRSSETLIQYGIVNIDKPSGPTSHQTSDFVQKILGIDKAGHAGTLDPGVTGVLPIALGHATRIVQALMNVGKEYVCLMHVHKPVSEDVLKKVFIAFTGKINQLPPIKSAVKRQLRTREIYYLEVMEIDGQDVLFKVGCQAGTYIRKLCFDMGKKLGCGAHMAELRRTKAACFDESTLVTLHDLTDAFHYSKEGNDKALKKFIQPVESALAHLPKVWVFDTTVESLCHGMDLKVPGIAKVHSGIQKECDVAIMTLKDELVALGTAVMDSKAMLGEKGIAVKTHKVFMLPGTYARSKGV